MRHTPGRKKDLRDRDEPPLPCGDQPAEDDRLLQELERIVAKTIERGGTAGRGTEARDPMNILEGLDADLDYRNFYREFIEKSNDAMFVIDLFGNLKFANRTTLRLMGYEKDDLLGENVARFLHADGLRKAVTVIASLVRGREIPSQEFTVKTASGDRMTEISVTLIRKGGFPLGVLGVARDVTESKQTERSLRESEARLAAAIENLPFDFFALDREGRYILQNSVCRENWGKIVGKTPAETGVDPETLARWEESNRRALAGEVVRTEISRSVDGEERRLYNVVSPVREGDEITGILGLSMDVTEQRRGEELVRTQRDLASSLAGAERLEEGLNACLSAALEASGMEVGGIYLFDPQRSMLELVAHRGLSRDYAQSVKRYTAHSPQAKIVRAGRAYFPAFGDLPQDIQEPLIREGLKVLAVLPILDERRIVGCMIISSRSREKIPEGAREALESIASQAGGALTRVRAKERLRESEKKYRDLISNIPVVSWTSDAKGNTVFISPNVQEICGFSAEEIMGGGHRLFLELVHPEDLSATETAYQALVREGADFDVEYRFRHKEGRWIWLRDRAYTRKEKGGMLAFGVFHEITERREAENALRESEERYRSLVEQSKELVFTTAEDGTVTYVNKTLESLSDWSMNDLMGRRLSEFVHPDDLPDMSERFSRTLRGESVPGGEVRLKMKSGETRSLEYTLSRLLRGEGGVAGLLGVARDVTDRKRMEADRRQVAALKERESISRWLHDNLGADLYNIILIAESVRKQTADSSVPQQQIDWITETSRKGLTSIRNYLDFSRRTGFTLQGLVSYMEEYGRSVLNPLGVQYIFEQSGAAGSCSLSGVQVFSMYLIFKESLTNIVKHARASKVDVVLSHEGGRLGLTIADNGKGFAPDAVLAGTFGTSSLRARAAEMGADLSIDSRPLQGTRVDLSLPMEGPARPE